MSFRNKRRGLHAMLTVCAVIVGVLAGTTQTASAFVACPAARTAYRNTRVLTWESIWGTRRETAKGVTLCRGWAGEGVSRHTAGFLQIVDLADGAKVRVQAQADPETEPGYFATHTGYRKRTAQSWYLWIRSLRRTNETAQWLEPGNERLISVTNATFFKNTINGRDTELPFPLLSGAGQETLGVSFAEAYPAFPLEEWQTEEPLRNSDYDAPKSALLLSDNLYEAGRTAEIQKARVRGFRSRYEIEDMAAWDEEPVEVWFTMDAAVSFRPEYDVGGERQSKRRTYVGVWGSKLYVWVTEDSFTNAQANAAMQEIQPAMDVIGMDGGGSSQFYSPYGVMLSVAGPFLEQRDVPTVLAIYRAR